VKLSGGISNLSFGFRGVNKIRELIHSVFLHHAILESGVHLLSVQHGVTMYDGAMGTKFPKQSRWPDEAAFRGEHFTDWTSNVKGNNDLLSRTSISRIFAANPVWSAPTPSAPRPSHRQIIWWRV
jgi:hypothetical protein